ncbi:hypothetical protein ACFQ1I_41140 [Kitasatospora arboriphila]
MDRVYTEQRDDLAASWWWILAASLLALVALGALQRTLAVRFRRLVNPLLAAVTLLTAVALLTGLHLTGQADRHLVVAKSNAYDSVLALSRARATAYDMNADESRYLTDPARAAAYEQSFLDKTQAFARLDGAALDDYDRRLDAAARAHRTDHSDIPFGGYLGDELRNITFAGEQGASERVLETFRQYQLDDRRMRALRVQGRLKEAVTFNTGLAAYQSNADFAELGEALDAVLAVNRQAMDRAVAQADGELDGPAAAAVPRCWLCSLRSPSSVSGPACASTADHEYVHTPGETWRTGSARRPANSASPRVTGHQWLDGAREHFTEEWKYGLEQLNGTLPAISRNKPRAGSSHPAPVSHRCRQGVPAEAVCSLRRLDCRTRHPRSGRVAAAVLRLFVRTVRSIASLVPPMSTTSQLAAPVPVASPEQEASAPQRRPRGSLQDGAPMSRRAGSPLQNLSGYFRARIR